MMGAEPRSSASGGAARKERRGGCNQPDSSSTKRQKQGAFPCPYCGHISSNRQGLSQHLNSMHPDSAIRDTGSLKYGCKYCNYKANTAEHIQRHWDTACPFIPRTTDQHSSTTGLGRSPSSSSSTVPPPVNRTNVHWLEGHEQRLEADYVTSHRATGISHYNLHGWWFLPHRW